MSDSSSFDEDEVLLFDADAVVVFEDGTVKYYRNGEEIPYPWIKLE